MKFALVQIHRPVHENVFEYCFMVILTNMTLEEAMLERSKLNHPERYIIIQVW